MSTNYQAATLETLRMFLTVDSMTVTNLAEKLGASRAIAKNKIDNLHTKGLLESHRNTVPAYFITSKGVRLLAAKDPKEKGAIPKPRSFVPEGTYTPKPIYTRPGADDFLACPSLRGEERVAHRLPISLTGGA